VVVDVQLLLAAAVGLADPTDDAVPSHPKAALSKLMPAAAGLGSAIQMATKSSLAETCPEEQQLL
jgi:hypothetical protein